MITVLYQAHSGWRYIVILAAIVAFVKLIVGLISNSRWSQLDEQLGRTLPIVMDIQVLLGLILWIMERRWSSGDPLRTWEHPVTMIVAVAVAHSTWSRVKKSSDNATKFRVGTIGYAVAGLILAVGVMRVTGGM